ncbi:MAG TPA: HAMP domain-containing sensor histidine kinase [Candidatus Stackebrandtia excrementipullorum]|nr:HAMP domain-containing sensor histidine kinase [Candidatus Stackebrandtia excrementipullorum]
MSLFWRIFLLNSVMLITGILLLLFGPITVSESPQVSEILILFSGFAGLLVINAGLLKLGLRPLRRLVRVMTATDLLSSGPRPAMRGHAGIADLIRTFNTMLDRLEAERALSTARALSAQEDERRRVAQELHDEVGQSLTAVLLELKRVKDHAPEELREELRQVQETTRDSLDEIRRIARRLRPGVLEELGLNSALKALTSEVAGSARLTVHRKFDSDLPELGDEAELVLYRVAQESITNTARHARARRLEVSLRRVGNGILLRLRDDGKGLGRATEGAGMRGMRERALLVGADLSIADHPEGGTEVRLHLPVRNRSASQ